MRETKQAPAWLPYPLLTVLLGGFVFIAFRLMETARVWSAWLFAGKAALQSVEYAVLALYFIGVLVCLPLLEKRLSRCADAAAMAALGLFAVGWQCAVYGGLTALYALPPAGEWRLAAGLLPAGIALLCVPFVRRRR